MFRANQKDQNKNEKAEVKKSQKFKKAKNVSIVVRGNSRTVLCHYSATRNSVMKRWLKIFFVPPSFFPPSASG